MYYQDFKGLQLSALGYGCMRFPVFDGKADQVDEAAAAEMIDLAMRSGVNYYDTAWPYHGGESENLMGRILKKYPRDSFYIATKFPGIVNANMPHVKEIFNRQLEKLQMDYFDFYLLHNVSESNIDDYLDPKFGVIDYLLKMRDAGKIRHFGFSSHGELSTMKRFLDLYGKEMEFCQIQLNWLDWSFQHAKEKVELLTEYGIPVWVMEPVRGGKLARLPEAYSQELSEIKPGESPVSLAFRFVQSVPEVKVVLSGMSTMEQVRENAEIFSAREPLTEEQLDKLRDITERLIKKDTVPCTGCGYCATECPQGLDIPRLMELFNEHNFTGKGFIAPRIINILPEDKRPSACLGCGACAAVCPQRIDIPGTMERFCKILPTG